MRLSCCDVPRRPQNAAMHHVDDLAGIATDHGLFPIEAYAFVAEAMQHIASDGHVTADELVDGLLALAAERYGLLARTVLRSWGLRSSREVGLVTFHLVEHGVFGKLPDDRREDFDHGPDFHRRLRELVVARL